MLHVEDAGGLEGHSDDEADGLCGRVGGRWGWNGGGLSVFGLAPSASGWVAVADRGFTDPVVAEGGLCWLS